MELKPFGIHVVIVEPGAIKTEWGDIAHESLLATSGAGPYGKQAKTRYVVGSGARPLLLARRLLTDRGFDRLLGLGYRFAR
jgi:NAD(P)-dependent dehydrogenase (short-subunit alcohol dehydrogenase family)